MSGFLICKVTKNNIVVILDGTPRTLHRRDVAAEEVISLVGVYNGEKDLEKRVEIKDKLEALLSPGKRIVMASDNRFEFDEKQHMYLTGTTTPIPSVLAKKLLEFIKLEAPIDALINFWKHLLLNPDEAVRKQLYGFIAHRDIAISTYGYLVCAKAVKIKRKFDKETGEQIVVREYDEDTGELIQETMDSAMTFTPYHSGPHGMTVKMGEPIAMPRAECDPDPEVTCSTGLHVGAIEYVKDFGYSDGAILEVLVNPRNVVSVPIDYNNTKMRCCEYYPIAITNGENKAVYLESDYKGFDDATLDKELAEYEANKLEIIETLNKQMDEMNMIKTQIKNIK